MNKDKQQFEIVYFELDNGDCPVEVFIGLLDSKMKAKVFMEMALLEELGNLLRFPYSEYLSDGIFELRVSAGTDITRFLYFFTEGRKIVMTNGFVKKTQKTPAQEIKKAKRYKAMYEERKHEDIQG